MKSFRPFYIQPLKLGSDLPINRDNYHQIDVTDMLENIHPDLREKLVNNILNITSNGKGSILTSGYGESQFVSVNIAAPDNKTKRLAIPEPNPIHLYLSVAVQHLQAATEAKRALSQLDAIDEKGFAAFCDFAENMMAGIVFLVMAIEGFMNFMTDDAMTYLIEGQNKSKTDIEWMSFGEKIGKALPVISGVDFFATYPNEYGRLNNLANLRHDLVHLKKFTASNFTFYQDIFKRLLDFKTHENYDAAILFMNTLQPRFVNMKE